MADPNEAGVLPKRLSSEEIDANFSDLHPPLTAAEAVVEADRCYFCFDAPCIAACPTDIDIPVFIQKIRSGNIEGAARTILSENIMGGMCARVCPTEILCEDACVRNTREEKPVEIGLLQRHATDAVIDAGKRLFHRRENTGKTVAIIGAGPAGISCAHGLAQHGHTVVIFNRDEKPGGLNEYGIAAYKTVDDFAQRELDYILGIGGITLMNGYALGEQLDILHLMDEYDAVFLATGLAESNTLNIDGEDLDGVVDAIDYIAQLRQAEDKRHLPVGRDVIVVGGGMTAIDIAVQSRHLGAQNVHIVYRGEASGMSASVFEQALAQTSGVGITFNATPTRIIGGERVTGVAFDVNGESLTLEADVVFKAIGQRLDLIDGPDIEDGRIVIDEQFRTSLRNVWAGGDCVARDDNLTVSAVQHGKLAALSMDAYLRSEDDG